MCYCTAVCHIIGYQLSTICQCSFTTTLNATFRKGSLAKLPDGKLNQGARGSSRKEEKPAKNKKTPSFPASDKDGLACHRHVSVLAHGQGWPATWLAGFPQYQCIALPIGVRALSQGRVAAIAFACHSHDAFTIAGSLNTVHQRKHRGLRLIGPPPNYDPGLICARVGDRTWRSSRNDRSSERRWLSLAPNSTSPPAMR